MKKIQFLLQNLCQKCLPAKCRNVLEPMSEEAWAVSPPVVENDGWGVLQMSRRLKSPSSSYIFERFSLQTCASWPVKRYSELPKTITWELVHLWKNCMKCIVGSMKLHDVISLSLKLLTVCLRIVNFKCQSKRMLSDVLWALQALMFWSFFWNLHRIER